MGNWPNIVVLQCPTMTWPKLDGLKSIHKNFHAQQISGPIYLPSSSEVSVASLLLFLVCITVITWFYCFTHTGDGIKFIFQNLSASKETNNNNNNNSNWEKKSNTKNSLVKWIPRVLGVPRNSNLFQDMQMRKDKKPWNIWEWVKTPVGIFGNS